MKIMSTTPLGDNHLEIFPGTPQAGDAPNGALLRSQTYVDLNSLLTQLNELAPRAQQLLVELSDRVGELKDTVARKRFAGCFEPSEFVRDSRHYSRTARREPAPNQGHSAKPEWRQPEAGTPARGLAQDLRRDK